MLFWAYFRSVAVGHMLPVVEVLTNQPAREADHPLLEVQGSTLDGFAQKFFWERRFGGFRVLLV